jgi:hypothetical protein
MPERPVNGTADGGAATVAVGRQPVSPSAHVAAPADVAPDGSTAPSGKRDNADVREIARQIARLFGIVTAVLVGIAAVGPVLDMLYAVRPDLRPEGPPVARGVTLADAALEERSVTCYDGAACNRVGYDIEFLGYHRDRVEIAWAAFDPVTLRRVDLEARGAPAVGKDKVELFAVAEAPSDRASNFIDVPIPAAGACIFIRISVFDVFDGQSAGGSKEGSGFGTRLDVAETRPFHTHDPTATCAPGGDGAASP